MQEKEEAVHYKEEGIVSIENQAAKLKPELQAFSIYDKKKSLGRNRLKEVVSQQEIPSHRSKPLKATKKTEVREAAEHYYKPKFDILHTEQNADTRTVQAEPPKSILKFMNNIDIRKPKTNEMARRKQPKGVYS